MSRESVLAGSGAGLLAEVFAQKVLTGCTDVDLVIEAVRRGLMEPLDDDDYGLTELGRKVRRTNLSD
jgi:hypothetical protein